MNQNPYCGQPPQPPQSGPQPYGAPHQPSPYGNYPSQPQPDYPGAPGSGGKKGLIIGIGALVAVIGIVLALWLGGVFGGGSSELRRDYSISAPGEAPPLTLDFISHGTWQEACGRAEQINFQVGGKLKLFGATRVQEGEWVFTGDNGMTLTLGGRSKPATVVPLGPDTIRMTVDNETKTLLRC